MFGYAGPLERILCQRLMAVGSVGAAAADDDGAAAAACDCAHEH